MSIQGITTGLPGTVKTAGFDILIPGAKGFADTLTIGQIIKGRVLRHFGADRYLVDFGGQEHVVDSAVPLRTDDLIHGRVVALGERIELQRVGLERQGAQLPQPLAPPSDNAVTIAYGRSGDILGAALANYNATLTAEARAAALSAVRSVPEPDLMARVAVALNRLGLPQSPTLLRAVYAAASRDGQLISDASTSDDLPILAKADHFSTDQTAATVSALANTIQQNLEEITPHRGPRANSPQAADTSTAVGDGSAQISVTSTGAEKARNDHAKGSDAGQLARWVLNAQTGGAVAHRVATLSLLLENQLVEVEVALFDQREESPGHAATRHRHVVLSLNMAELGRVNVTAKLAGEHLRLRITAETDAATEVLARYMGDLRSDVTAVGWQLDELAYETATRNQPNFAVRTVVEHLISQDSLSRLM